MYYSACWCTLPLTNPNACEYCNNNPNRTTWLDDYFINTTITTYPLTEDWIFVDKSKFDIVEKKGAKIERIKKNIEELLVELETKSKEVDEEISRMEKMKETIEGLNKELKELEDK